MRAPALNDPEHDGEPQGARAEHEEQAAHFADSGALADDPVGDEAHAVEHEAHEEQHDPHGEQEDVERAAPPAPLEPWGGEGLQGACA